MLQPQVTPKTSMVRHLLVVLVVLVGAFVALIVGIIVWFLVSYSLTSNAAYSRYDAADVRPLRRIIAHMLPSGSTVAQAQAALNSRHITAFIQGRGFETLGADTTFHPLPSYQSNMVESETYPRGKALFAETKNWGNGTAFSERYLDVWLFFDTKGRFTGCSIDESFVSL
jgi:hypothetical protein